MKRRSFLSLSALSTIPVTAAADAVEVKTPEDTWWETVETGSLKFQAGSFDDELVLDVELFIPPHEEVTEVTDEKGQFLCYRYKGKDMPSRFWSGQSLLTRFDLKWDGKRMTIPERFWSDLAGLDIQTSTLNPATLKPELQWKAEDFLQGLRQPRVMLSAEGGTALIEWVRPEECDSRSTIRWIISRSGTVLRHRHELPHDC